MSFWAALMNVLISVGQTSVSASFSGCLPDLGFLGMLGEDRLGVRLVGELPLDECFQTVVGVFDGLAGRSLPAVAAPMQGRSESRL